ncbi:MAG: threonine--tRNA ligase, partial [Nanoarchaeota archaeon]|nr:threonine--tRNA ligase [Nanoarchaeota archaeon]
MAENKYPIETIRHSAAHLLAQAVKELFPEAKLGIGPNVENGFYYDFDRETAFTPEDLKKLEDRMRRHIKAAEKFEKIEYSEKEARQLLKDEPYKIELMNDLIKEGEKPTFYKHGSFIDLCRGPHVNSTADIKAFSLTKIAAAYWKGNQENKQLQRIYGLAFQTKEELEAYVKRIEEAEKRDHNKIGKQLDLFIISELVGKGLPLLPPKGATIKRILRRFIEDEELKRGYLFTETPVLARSELYKISGHLDHYKDSMFVFESNGEEFVLRPMTCPHQFMIYKSKLRSYRELPIRYAEVSTLFRNEQSGELHGLIRIRQFTLADAHIICRPDQLEEEFKGVVNLIQYVMGVLGFTDFWYRFSRWDPSKKGKYIDNPEAWKKSENIMKKILDEMKINYAEAAGEAAFYGPKLDIQMRNAFGKEDTMFTVQIDFALPERFKMVYTGEDGKEHTPLVIHRASIGCLERTMALLIEKYEGRFPLWLSPIQVKIMTLNDNCIP